MKKSSYLQKGRIRDVISLINFLATKQNGNSYHIEISKNIDSKPKSLKTWDELSKLHPEFFITKKHTNENFYRISLYSQKTDQLTIDENLRLVEIATSLHDSELNKRNYWAPMITAIFTAVIAAMIALYSLYYNKNKLEDNLRKIINSENIILLEESKELTKNNRVLAINSNKTKKIEATKSNKNDK